MSRSCLKIRLYPDRAQERELEQTLETCRLVYNSLVNDRKFQYDTAKVFGNLHEVYKDPTATPLQQHNRPLA